jgi:hypothetical protein
MHYENENSENEKNNYSAVALPYSLQECVQNYYSEPRLWDEMVRIHRHP